MGTLGLILSLVYLIGFLVALVPAWRAAYAPCNECNFGHKEK